MINYPEMAYVYRNSTENLEIFITGFFAVLREEKKQDLRSKELINKYQKYLKGGGGSFEIREKMNGSTRVFVENIFPYDALIPLGSKLIHLCLFSEEPLNYQEIDEMIERDYPKQAAFVFVHNESNRTIKEIWHAHVVVDLDNRS